MDMTDIQRLELERNGIAAKISQARRDADLTEIRRLRVRAVEIEDVIIVARIQVARSIRDELANALGAKREPLTRAEQDAAEAVASFESARQIYEEARLRSDQSVGQVAQIRREIQEAQQRLTDAQQALDLLSSAEPTEPERLVAPEHRLVRFPGEAVAGAWLASSSGPRPS